METIEVYFDPKGMRGGQSGWYRARLKSNHGIHDAGKTTDEAISNFLTTAASLGHSGNRNDYTIENK